MLPEEIYEHIRAGRFDTVLARIPYIQMMGFQFSVANGIVTGTMPYAEHIVGNAKADALHGGTLGSLMESTALITVLHSTLPEKLPRTINITVEYLRRASRRDTFARAEFLRRGRRISNLRVVCFQDDVDKPVAAATTHVLMG